MPLIFWVFLFCTEYRDNGKFLVWNQGKHIFSSFQKKKSFYLGIVLLLQHLCSCFIYATFQCNSATQTCQFHSRGHSWWPLEWNKLVQDHSSVSNKHSNIQIDNTSIICRMQPNKYRRIEKNSKYLMGQPKNNWNCKLRLVLKPR